MLEPRTTRKSDNDLPPNWTRYSDRMLLSPGGWLWRQVRRHELGDLTDEEWVRTRLMLRRPPTGWHPCGPEGHFIGNVLHETAAFGLMPMQTMMYVVAYFTDEGEERDYITRAVRDKRAHLAVLSPAERPQR
jgi:hypothetical protein